MAGFVGADACTMKVVANQSGMNRKLILLVVVAGVAWWLWSGPVQAPMAVELAGVIPASSGFDSMVSIDQPPVQHNLSPPPVLQIGDHDFTLMADFQLEARVLGRRDYRHDPGASLAPIDLALGWGPMARAEVVDQIEIRQRGRFYFWRADHEPIDRSQIVRNSANMHLIPASPEVFEELRRAESGRTVRLRGNLVNVSRADGWRWHTSMTRSDSGNGACELFLVTLARVF